MEVQMENTGRMKTMTKNETGSDDGDLAGTEKGEAFKIADASEAKEALTQGERDLVARLASAAVADAVGLMMRSERHRHYSLADLEWLIMPPLMLNQVMFAYARPQIPAAKAAAASKAGITGDLPPAAVAMITWAFVSADIAAKLDAQKKAGLPFRLAPHEWRSGKERRLIEVLGEDRAIKSIMSKLQESSQG